MKIKKKQIYDDNGQLRNTSIWEIEVDYQNLNDIETLFQRIKPQYCTLKAQNSMSKKDLNKLKFDACVEIYNTDISHLYKNLNLDVLPNYYVYAHCENKKIAINKDGVTSWLATHGLDLIPFYIGKGCGNRAYDLNRNETHRKIKQRLKEFNSEIQVRIIKDNLTELEALCLESKLIDIFGILGKGGKLVNLDEGINSKDRHQLYKNHLINLNNYYKNLLE